MALPQRLKSFRPFTKRIAEFRYVNAHNEIKEAVVEGAQGYGCDPEELSFAWAESIRRILSGKQIGFEVYLERKSQD
jgi:hypothetical protein